MKSIALIVGWGVIGLLCHAVSGGDLATRTIDNGLLKLNYDGAAATFSVAEIASGAVFLKDGKLDGTATATTIENVTPETTQPESDDQPDRDANH